jgi:lysozyme
MISRRASRRFGQGAAGLALGLLVTGCGAPPPGLGEKTGTTSAAVTVCGMTSVTGIDVYHGDNNGNPIDWSTVAAGGQSFGFAKATESTNFDDPQFSANWAGMKAADMKRGAYHFHDPSADPMAQAQFFLQAVGTPSPGDMLVLDFETSGGLSDQQLAAAADTFLSAVQTATGITPMLYASSDFLSDWGDLGKWPLWVANYGVTCPGVPSAWTTYTFWQNSGSGMVGGIGAAVDTDVYNGTVAELMAMGGTTTQADAGPPPVDAAPPPPDDAGLDSGTSPPPVEDSGASPPPVVDSGSSHNPSQDSGTAGGGTDAGPRRDAGTFGEAPGNSPSGCGCRAAGGGGNGPWGWLTGGVAVVAVWSRRRRRASQGRSAMLGVARGGGPVPVTCVHSSW